MMEHSTVRPNPPAVILGGSTNAVSVARSLGRAGVPVYAIGNALSVVGHSRHCRGFVDLGDDANVQEHWLDWLDGHGPRGAVLLPCDDDGLELIARNRRALVELGYLPVEADDDVVLAMLDKSRTYELARRIGVPSPRTVTPRNVAELEALSNEIAYPCALKPSHSHLFQRHSGMNAKALIVFSSEELAQALGRLHALGLEMVVTEIVPGGEDQFCSYYSYLDERGDPLFHLTKRKLRQFPTGFGMGCYHVTDWNPEVAEVGLRFLQGVGLRGLANVEFKRDARDGQLKLIECNHRFTAANEQLRIAGMDLALFAYNRLLGRPGPPVDSYRSNVRLWVPIDDTRAFLSHRRRGELSLVGWVRSLLHVQHFPVFSWKDPKPTIVHHWRMLVRVGRRRRGRSSAPGAHQQAEPGA